MVSATDLADVLLAVAIRRRHPALMLEPAEGEHRLTAGPDSSPALLATLPARLGNAVAVRLALLAHVDPWEVDGQIGRLIAEAAGVRGEFLLVLRRVDKAFAVELRAVASTTDQPVAQGALTPGVPARIGPYRVESELGHGGMGVVYRAVAENPARTVALKVLHAELARDRHLAFQFVREGRAASLAHHPGIVGVLDFGTLPDGRAYLVMELVEDGTLEEALTQGPFEARRAARIARRICAALEAAHVRGVIHRDLKPSNVFLGSGDTIKIADFGAAKLESAGGDVSVTHVVMGTPRYMSPEQARGLATDGRSDLYALGCILFRMITGRLPFQGETQMDVLVQHMNAPVPPLDGPLGPPPASLAAVVLKALAKRPEDRFQSAGEMAAALDAVLTTSLDERRGGPS